MVPFRNETRCFGDLVRMAVQKSFDGLPEIDNQVKSIGNLLGLGRTTSRSLDIAVTTIPADDFHARVRREPFGKRLR